MGKPPNFGSSAIAEKEGQWHILAQTPDDNEYNGEWAVSLQKVGEESGLECEVRLSWGNGGVQHQIIIAPRAGFVTTVPGSFVRLEVRSIDTSDPQEYYGSISQATGGSRRPIYDLGGSEICPANSSIEFEVPDFATRYQVVAPLAPSGFQVSQDGGGPTFLYPSGSIPDWQVIVSKYPIVVTNPDLVDNIGVTVIYELSL